MRGSQRELLLYIAGHLAGHVRQDRDGFLSFSYTAGYSGVPVSLSMPISSETYPQRVLRPYLMGLLPDDPTVRADIGDLYGCSGENPFALLSHIGLDCPGAVQLASRDDASLVEDRSGRLVPLSPTQVEERLRLLRERSSSPWGASGTREGRWSLGGAQSKMALRHHAGTWYACEGSEATTHILKPGVVGYNDQALDEYLCQRVASELGLPAAQVAYATFGEERAVVIERYDRAMREDGTVERIHQEDMCQALGVDPSRKYAEQGGPSSPDVIALLSKTGKNSPSNLRTFILFLFFNYLMGATDAHAKNYSVLLGEGGFARIAPLYDVASIAPYQSLSPRRRKPLRAAMSIGGENRFGMLKAENLEMLAHNALLVGSGVTYEWIAASALRMAQAIPTALHGVIQQALDNGTPGTERIAERLEGEIAANCRRLIERL